MSNAQREDRTWTSTIGEIFCSISTPWDEATKGCYLMANVSKGKGAKNTWKLYPMGVHVPWCSITPHGSWKSSWDFWTGKQIKTRPELSTNNGLLAHCASWRPAVRGARKGGDPRRAQDVFELVLASTARFGAKSESD